MAQLQIVYLLRPRTQEQWRRLYQEIAESRREEIRSVLLTYWDYAGAGQAGANAPQ